MNATLKGMLAGIAHGGAAVLVYFWMAPVSIWGMAALETALAISGAVVYAMLAWYEETAKVASRIEEIWRPKR